MNQNDINSILIEAQHLMELVVDDVYQQRDKKFDPMVAKYAVIELVQRAKFLHQGNASEFPTLSHDTLELISRLDADCAIDNAQYMAKGEKNE